MLTIPFKLSNELVEVFKTSQKDCLEKRLSTLTPEIVLWNIVDKYCEGIESGKGCEEFESTALFKSCSEMTNDMRLKFRKEVYDLAFQNLQTTPAGFGFDPTKLTLSDSLELALHRAKGSEELKNATVNATTVTEINTEMLIISMILDRKNGGREIEKVLKVNKITMEDLIASDLAGTFINKIMKEDGITDLLKRFEGKETGKLKEKHLDYDDPDEPDDPEKEQKEFENAGRMGAVSSKKIDPNSNTPALDEFATDITANAKDGKYDPVIGRDKEISQIIEILCCRKKNNAMITGVPGGGKSSVVEKLAQKIVAGDVPTELKGKRIFSLDLNALVSGCQFRGQYEERLQKVIKEVVSNPEIIIFIDEAHNLVGNGSSSGSGDGANILKPYLANGEFQMIGATTDDEYRKIIEKDGALKRRFTPVRLSDLTTEETTDILKGISSKYSEFHHVKYTPDVLKACAEWSGKYINDRFFPDKAISVLDMASSIAKLEPKPADAPNPIEELEKEIENAKTEKNKALDDCDFEACQNWRDIEKDLQKKLNKEKSKKDTKNWPIVTIDHVASVISKVSNVPVDKIRDTDIEKVKGMNAELKKKIIGQDEAVREVTTALQRNILGLRDPNKPIASFLLCGSTGVGKTYLAKLVAKEFMGSENNLETIACSEYMEDWAESKLLGSAPGYVGYSDTEPRLYVLKRKPYCVLLIDELEKSSTNLYNIWLNMLEEGEVTLSSGEKVSLRNCIVIFSSNVGTKSLEMKGKTIGFSGPKSKDEKRERTTEIVMEEIKKEFRPEFINRLSKIIVFNSLGQEEMKSIFDLELDKLKTRLHDSGYSLTVSGKVRDMIVSKCEPEYGARSLQRLIVQYVEEEICNAMLETDDLGKKKIKVDLTDDKKISVMFK